MRPPRSEGLFAHRDELLAAVVHTPLSGQALFAVLLREPYASKPSVLLVDADALPLATLAAVKAARTATMSAFEGLSRSERAIDLAVRKRSYVSVAAAISLGLALLWSTRRRPSNSSLPSIAAPCVVDDADRSGAGARLPSAKFGGKT